MCRYSPSPSGVKIMPRFVREKSGQPISASKFRIARVKFGWLFCSASAAFVRLPHLAT